MVKFINERPEEFGRHYRKWKDCERCEIGRLASQKILRVRGHIPCEILFVGMSPAFSEDGSRGGYPMTGATKSIIDCWIEESGVIELRWAIQNIIACFSRSEEKLDSPRDPTRIEMENCQERLIELVQLCEPGQIVLLGELARKNFPKRMFSEMQYLDLPHPAFLKHKSCRNPSEITARAILELKRFAFGG